MAKSKIKWAMVPLDENGNLIFDDVVFEFMANNPIRRCRYLLGWHNFRHGFAFAPWFNRIESKAAGGGWHGGKWYTYKNREGVKIIYI